MGFHFFELRKLPDEISEKNILLLWVSLFKAETEEDLEKIKKKHRSDELREIMEADMKYLKAMINKLERERQELSTQNFSAPSVTLEISGVQMPVQTMEAPVTPEGEVIDVSL